MTDITRYQYTSNSGKYGVFVCMVKCGKADGRINAL